MAGTCTTQEYRTPKDDSPHKPAASRYQFGPGLLPEPWRLQSKESCETTAAQYFADVLRWGQKRKLRAKHSPERGCKARQAASTQNKSASGSPDGECRPLLPAA